MNENVCVFEGRRHEGCLIDGNSFLDLLPQPIRGGFESLRNKTGTPEGK